MNYFTYNECKAFLAEHKVASLEKFRRFAPNHKQVPTDAFTHYHGTGEWKGWGDFLMPRELDTKYPPYEDARAIVVEKKFGNSSDYKANLPKGLPLNAKRYYKRKDQWISWDHYLGK